MIRCYLPPESWGEIAGIQGQEARHLARVLRVKVGQKLICFDGLGSEAEGLVTRVTGKEVFLKLDQRKAVPGPGCAISLAVAIPRHGKLDQMVNQATQLGVSQIIPLMTTRGVVRWDPTLSKRKEERLIQISIEAAKQCARCLLPTVRPVTAYSAFLDDLKRYDLSLIATPAGPHEEMKKLLARDPLKSLAILIGPEGDFTPEEIVQATRKGAHRISLGSTVLRCDTAVVAVLAIVSFLLRENPDG
jgi:16S rRNA (uracil1498-N3)-methyltransferase